MTDIAQFINSLGVNTHVDATNSAYGNIALVQASLSYIGFSLIRDHAYDIDLTGYTTLANAGIGLDLILDDDPKAEIDSLVTLAPAIRYFEGPNEVDYQPILTNGIADPVLAAVTEQQSVQTAIHDTAVVSSVKLIAESVAYPVDLAPFAGNLAYADIMNLHAYAVQGQSPRTVLTDDLTIAQSLLNQLDTTAVTETGYFTLPDDPNGVDETVQAKLTLDTLFDSVSLGLSPTFLYELLDQPPDPNDPTQAHYGLFTADGSPKLAATALHNLTTILVAANTTPGTAPVLSLSATLPDTGHTLVLNGDAGTTVVAVWAEPQIWDSTAHAEIDISPTMTTIDFGTLVASAIVLDPLAGTEAIAVYSDVSSISVGLTDHPLLIEISAPTPTPAPAPATPITPPPTPSPGSPDQTIGVYRFFDTSNGTYFYTASASEAQMVRQTRPDLVAEGTGGIGLVAIATVSSDPYAVPVYRFFDTTSGTHFFTASAAERDTLIATRPDLSYEPDSVFYEHTTAQPGDTPVYRFFDSVHGTHFYTDSAAERAAIISTRADLVAEGISFYEPAANPV